MRFLTHTCPFLICATGALLPAQQTWKVNCNGGPGVHFTDVPSAVAAAAPGDTVLVYKTFDGCPGAPGLAGAIHTAPTITKGINLVGFTVYPQQHVPAPGSPPSRSTLHGTLTVTGIAAGERVTVSTLGVGAADSTTTGGFLVSNCQGQVVFDGVFAGGSQYPNTVMEVNNCADVTLRGCQLLLGGAALRVINSNVRMSRTVFASLFPPASTGGYPQQPPASIELINSTLTMTGSTIAGPREWLSFGMLSKPGVVLTNSTMFIGPGTILQGGLNDGNQHNFPYLKRTSAPSYVYRDPRTNLNTINGSPPWVLQDTPATFIEWALANDLMRTHVIGPHDGFALLMLSDMPMAPVTTPFGTLLIDAATAQVVDLLYLPATNNGIATVDYFLPPSAPAGHAFVMQSLMLSPTGQLGLSLPIPFTVGWEHGRLP